MLIQFWEDYSDRQMEKAVKENLAIKWFCGFGLIEETPDHTCFCKLRNRLGTKKLADIFNGINEKLREKGLFGDTFKFIDASAIVTKTALWGERDKAIKKGEETLNNQNVEKYAADKEARWGKKSKNNVWYGYKRHESVDMKHGLIDKLTVTVANVLDWQVFKEICPSNCMGFMDKMYDCREVRFWSQVNNCHLGTILKNNNPKKNKDRDKWASKVRMPFEGVFSKVRRRAKFRGRVKVLFQCYAEAICHNLKKAVIVIPLEVGA